MRCSAVRADWLACVCVCVGGFSNQRALSTNEGREGPPVQGRWAESSGMGLGDGGCGEQLLGAGCVCVCAWCVCMHFFEGGCVCVFVIMDAVWVYTYFTYLLRTPESLSRAEGLRDKLLRRPLGGRFGWERKQSAFEFKLFYWSLEITRALPLMLSSLCSFLCLKSQ